MAARVGGGTKNGLGPPSVARRRLTSLDRADSPMNVMLPKRKDAGTRSNATGPGLPWRMSLIRRIGGSRGWAMAKNTQKLNASQKHCGSCGGRRAAGA